MIQFCWHLLVFCLIQGGTEPEPRRSTDPVAAHQGGLYGFLPTQHKRAKKQTACPSFISRTGNLCLQFGVLGAGIPSFSIWKSAKIRFPMGVDGQGQGAPVPVTHFPDTPGACSKHNKKWTEWRKRPPSSKQPQKTAPAGPVSRIDWFPKHAQSKSIFNTDPAEHLPVLIESEFLQRFPMGWPEIPITLHLKLKLWKLWMQSIPCETMITVIIVLRYIPGCQEF